jgi:hypothetical protein
MKATAELHTGLQVAVVLILNTPLIGVIFLGWSFYAIYSVLCFAMGMVAVLAWVVPSVQRVVFVAGVPQYRIRKRLVFAIIFSFSAAVLFHYASRT